MSVIRDERLPDAPAVRAVLEAAFSQAVEADLVDKLRVACRERISSIMRCRSGREAVQSNPGYRPSLCFEP